jgi:type IV pilus assembly protein PilQ
VGVIGLWIALSAAGVEAQEAAPVGSLAPYAASGEEAPPDESSHYITLDVKEKDLEEILKFVSRRVGVNIVADPAVKEKVTVQLDSVEWRSALEVIARQTNCKIVEETSRLLRFTQPPSISMEFLDADIKVVLDLLAKQAAANIVHAPDVQGKVSLSLREVPWREALETIVKTAGFVLVRSDTDSSTEILRVMRPEALKEQLETRYFQLRYVRPDPSYRAIIADVEKVAVSEFQGQGSSQAFAAKKEKNEDADLRGFTLAKALKETISEGEGGSLNYDPHTNTFIVKETKLKLDEIEAIIKHIDVRPAQIHVEVKFISTNNNDILERGVKFDLQGTPERDGLIISGRGAQPNPNATDPLFLFGGNYPFDIGNLGDFDDNFQALGILDFTQVNVLLRLVKDDENSRIVQEPSLTMVDNKPATIFVGETVPFAVQQVQQDQNGNVTVALDENKRSPINVGFTLYLTPHVIPETDTIDLSVIPKVSTLTGTSSPIPGFERFQFVEADGATESFIDLPREGNQTVVTYLRVQDGHTAVIGGLQTERKTEIETKIPFLSSIPVLGNLFTWRRKQNTVNSLIILITPRLLKNVGDEDVQTRRSLEKHQKKDWFYQKYEKGADTSSASESP